MIKQMIKGVAEKLNYGFDVNACEHHKCMVIIDNEVITAVPFQQTEEISADNDFFLLTTHLHLAALFHEKEKKPVWICRETEDFRHISIPMHSGYEWAYILADEEGAWDACITAEYASLLGRVVSVLGGTQNDLIRTFFPKEWKRMAPDL